MTFDTLSILRDALIAQRDSCKLINLRQDLFDQAESQLQALKTKYKETGDVDVMEEHEAIISVLDEIRELRADIIWGMAYIGDTETGNLTPREKALYDPLPIFAAKLRGIA